MTEGEEALRAAVGSLPARLISALQIETAAEFIAAKELFELTVAAAPIDGSLPPAPEDLAGFRLAQAALFQLRVHRKNLTPNGVIWRGRPALLTDEWLADIRDEFAEMRLQAVHDRWGQFLGKPGPAVRRLLQSSELEAFIQARAGPVRSRRATCIYYEMEGAHIRPHVDTDGFSLNANLMVRHTGGADSRSRLVIYPLDGEPASMSLQDGELILFYADCIVHGRTPLSSGESVWALSLGFTPDGEFHE